MTPFRTKVITILILTVACFAVAYFFAVPQWNSYKTSEVQLANTQAQYNSLNSSLATVQSFIDSYGAHQDDAKLLTQALPVSNVDSADFVKNIGDLAQQSGMVLAQMQSTDSVVSADSSSRPYALKTESIHLSASGSYESFKDFVMRLEANLRLIDIQKMSMKADETGTLKYELDFQIYYQQ